MSVYDAIVIGGGLNGLVAGALLAKRKLAVLVLDRRPEVGGAVVTGEIVPGVSAPLLSHVVGPIDPQVVRRLRLDRAGVTFLTPDPALTTLGPAGEAVQFSRDTVLTAASINGLSPRDAARWGEFTKTTGRIASLIARLRRQPAPTPGGPAGPAGWWRMISSGRHALRLPQRELASLTRWVPMSIADMLDEWFEHDLVKSAIAARAIFGNFAGPRSGGTAAMFLQQIAADEVPVGSGMTAIGGPGAVTQALARIAAAAGASIRTGARVTAIRIESGRAAGVLLESGEEIVSRAVVSAVDPRQTILSLVPPPLLPPSFRDDMRHCRVRGVTAKINLALSAMPTFHALGGDRAPLAGRLLVAPGLDYLERAFDAAKYGESSPNPWLEVSVPTVNDPSLAPGGEHAMSIAVHFAPRHVREGSWDDARDALYRSVLQVLETHAPGIGSQVLGYQVVTPEDLETGWGLSGGHIFHGETTLDQSWAARPLLGWARYVTPLPRLFLAGAGTHPGGGPTGTSGLLAAEVVQNALRG